MSRIPEPTLPPTDVHPSVAEFADNVRNVLNLGKVEFRHQTTAPTDTPSGNEMRLATISGTRYLYVYFKEAAVWVRTTVS